jgi:hypothetical protein
MSEKVALVDGNGRKIQVGEDNREKRRGYGSKLSAERWVMGYVQ